MSLIKDDNISHTIEILFEFSSQMNNPQVRLSTAQFNIAVMK